jgi:transcriptional regulator of acetoin/glycerol metabolism
VPIQHPITGKTVGAVDLTCWRKDAGPLLITLAKTTADQIRQALLADSGMRELELFGEYLRVCRRTAGIVFAFNNDVVMMNDHARQVLDPADQSVLLAQAAAALAGRQRGPVLVELPTGLGARLYCRPVQGVGRLAGGVVHVKLTEPGGRSAADIAPPARMFLPSLVGAGPLWLRGCHEVEAAYDAAEWLALAGEPGVGKLALIRAVHQQRNPAGRFRMLDATAATEPDWLTGLRRELPDGEGTLVVRHADRLRGDQLQALSTMLLDARAAGRQDLLWVALTLGPGRPAGELATLLESVPSTVELPPLRHHIEDLHELVPFFLRRLNPHGRLVCSAEAMQLLVRSSWPGNAEQLCQVLRQVVAHRRTGTIQPNDLPPECRTVSRRVLSPLESMERDAIVRSLVDADGSKVKAARSLGMSRATIYRKIHEYGIVAPVG